jgi:hypothetical protein
MFRQLRGYDTTFAASIPDDVRDRTNRTALITSTGSGP